MQKQKVNVKVKLLSLVLAAVILAFSLSSCSFLLNNGMFVTPPYEVESVSGLVVKILDVGQGDSILVMTENKTLLIDAGLNESADVVIDCLEQYGRDTIDYIIATHPHADHIGGLDDVINYVGSVGCIYMPELPEKLVPTNNTYKNFLEAVLNTDTDVIAPQPGDEIQMEGALITFFGPVDVYDDLNDMSIVVRLDYGDASFLFTGDCRKGAFKDIIKAGYDVDVDVVKAAHHGAYNATDTAVFEAMSPDYMLISCGLDNSYGHPHREVVEMLSESETDFYRTDYNGTITVITDGQNLTVEAEKGIKNGR